MVVEARSVASATVVFALLVLAGCGGGGGGGGGQSTPARTPSGGGGGGGGGLVSRGKQIAQARGCQSCHSLDGSSGTGPTWKGLAGSKVHLVGGKTVTADDAYLTKSIEDPDADIVAGYQKGLMAGVVPKGSVSPADARALVAYIKTLK